jgi:tetratricopeptide (TPR) repeat protein
MRVMCPLVLAGLWLPLAGCHEFMINMTVDSTAPVLKRASASFDAESDVALAREALPGNLKTIDGFLAVRPEQPDLLELTALAYVQYAFGFLEDDLEALPAGDSPRRRELVERCTDLYQRAYDIGLRQVALDRPEVRTIARSGKLEALAPALKKVGKDAVPGLNWAGLGLASAINLHRDDIELVAELPRAMALLQRAYELDPRYYNYNAALSLAVIYAAQGKAVGGDPDRARQLFDEVIRGTGGRYLMAKVLYARYYATVVQDRALFDRTLKEVLATPGSVWPEQRLANELAHRRAARYLAAAEDLF